MNEARLVQLIFRQHELTGLMNQQWAAIRDAERELNMLTRKAGRAYANAHSHCALLAELDACKHYLDVLVPMHLLAAHTWSWIDRSSDTWQTWDSLTAYVSRPEVLENVRQSWIRMGPADLTAAGHQCGLSIEVASCTCEQWDLARAATDRAIADSESAVGICFRHATAVAASGAAREAELASARQAYLINESEFANNGAAIVHLKRVLKLTN